MPWSEWVYVRVLLFLFKCTCLSSCLLSQGRSERAGRQLFPPHSRCPRFFQDVLKKIWPWISKTTHQNNKKSSTKSEILKNVYVKVHAKERHCCRDCPLNVTQNLACSPQISKCSLGYTLVFIHMSSLKLLFPQLWVSAQILPHQRQECFSFLKCMHWKIKLYYTSRQPDMISSYRMHTRNVPV